MKPFLKIVVAMYSINIFTSCNPTIKTTDSVFPDQVSQACSENAIPQRYIVGWEDGHYSIEHSESDEDFKNKFIKDNLEKIKHVDRDFKIQTNTGVAQAVSEKLINYSTLNWGPNKIQAPAVWSQGYKGQNIIVGVVDGMVDKNHSQLAGNVLASAQFNNEINDPNENIHGTHVAGIIAADPNHGPVTGIAPSAKIVSGQFLGNYGGGTLGDGILALIYVASKGAKVINMSWGGAPCADNLKSVLSDLSSNGILLITASGNEGVNSDIYQTFPASFNLLNQINIAASTIDDLLIYFSNRGYKSVQIAAPGVDITSTIPNNAIATLDGTSMAAPMVTGAAALLWSAYPKATSQQIRTALMTSVDIPSSQMQVTTRGRLNVKKAFDSLKSVLLSQ